MTDLERFVQEYLAYLEIERGRALKTRANYERYLKVFVAQTKAARTAEITEAAVREFRLWLARQGFKKNTQAFYMIALRNFLRFLIKRGVRALSPDAIELPKVSRRDIEVMEYAELERILKAPKGDGFAALRDRALLETLFSTGLRLSELCALPRTIDLARGELSVRGKGDKLRIVFLSDTAKQAIAAYLKSRADTEEALFVGISPKGKVLGRIVPRTVQRIVDRCAKQAGIPKKVHPHLFRHSFATDLLVNGADLRSVQALLGHANVATTQIYTHLTNKELREVHQAFHGRRRQ